MLTALPGRAGRLTFADWRGEVGWYADATLGFAGFTTRGDAQAAAMAVRCPLLSYLRGYGQWMERPRGERWLTGAPVEAGVRRVEGDDWPVARMLEPRSYGSEFGFALAAHTYAIAVGMPREHPPSSTIELARMVHRIVVSCARISRLRTTGSATGPGDSRSRRAWAAATGASPPARRRPGFPDRKRRPVRQRVRAARTRAFSHRGPGRLGRAASA